MFEWRGGRRDDYVESIDEKFERMVDVYRE